MNKVARQLIFDLPVRNALGREDFFVSVANRAAVTRITDWVNWDNGKLLLCGPEGSGKTHLAHVWAKEADAVVLEASGLSSDIVANLVDKNRHIAVENIEGITSQSEIEQALFHLHNLVLSSGGRLLLTGQLSPANWQFSLPDLKSRVMGTELVQMDIPDDALLSAVLVKLFSDRQIDVTPDVVGFLVPRIERSIAAIGKLVAIMDTLALRQRSAITKKIARVALDEYATSET